MPAGRSLASGRDGRPGIRNNYPCTASQRERARWLRPPSSASILPSLSPKERVDAELGGEMAIEEDRFPGQGVDGGRGDPLVAVGAQPVAIQSMRDEDDGVHQT